MAAAVCYCTCLLVKFTKCHWRVKQNEMRCRNSSRVQSTFQQMDHVDWYVVTGAVSVPEGPCIELLVVVTLPPLLHALKLLF